MPPSSSFPAVPTRCPLCAQTTHVERVRCDTCATALEGRFSLGWVQQLSPEQLAFVRVFMTSRGKIKDVEQVLGLSYPTVVSRLDDVVAAIQTVAPASTTPRHENRKQILDDLAAGLIDADEAAQRLRHT